MAITNGYTTLTIIKAYLGITDTDDDTDLEGAVEAASRHIDQVCGRWFYARTAETRYCTAEYSRVLSVDDLLTLTTLQTDEDGDGTYEITWAATDYNLVPYTATQQTPPKPYTEIETSDSGLYAFPRGIRRGVKIVGDWGYCTEANQPPTLKRACLILAARIFQRKNAIFGVAGTSPLGLETIKPVPDDKDIVAMLTPLIKRF